MVTGSLKKVFKAKGEKKDVFFENLLIIMFVIIIFIIIMFVIK